MLNAENKALLAKLFYVNRRSVTIALRKFRAQANVKSGKGTITVLNLMKLIQQLEEVRMVEDYAKCGLPSLRKICSSHVAAKMEALAFESADGTNSGRESVGRLGLPIFKFCNILHGILDLNPHKFR